MNSKGTQTDEDRPDDIPVPLRYAIIAALIVSVWFAFYIVEWTTAINP